METDMTRGFLREEYRIFHSADKRNADFEVHAHTFHKIIACLSGHVDYGIEGTVYHLSAGDVLVIPAEQLHRSVFSDKEVYERFVLWIRTDLLEALEEKSLTGIFDGCAMMHCEGVQWEKLVHRLSSTEKYWYNAEEGHLLLARTYLIQALFLIRDRRNEGAQTGQTDRRLGEIIRYIADHPADKLTVEALCERFYMSESGLMHSFRKYTGCSVHGYIVKRRLYHAAALIHSGERAKDAAEKSGFSDYSVFLKAFKKEYGAAPTHFRNI